MGKNAIFALLSHYQFHTYMMKKQILDFTVVANERLHFNYSLLKMTPTNGDKLPEILPGQFVQVEVAESKNTFLRRPISINFVDYEQNIIWLLVRNAGEGTRHLIESKINDVINMIIPLGNGFSIPSSDNAKTLLIGGGVGVAPLLYFGLILKNHGIQPQFLLGARSKADILELNEFEKLGKVHISTEDGSMGEKGLVTVHSILKEKFNNIYCCGPAPMMKAVAKLAKPIGAECEVSLENMMACGLGACLCCVEKTVKGNVCVCTEGPVFNINQLTWQI